MTNLVSKNPDGPSPYILSILKSGIFSLNIKMNVLSVTEFGRCMPDDANIELFCFSVKMQSSGILSQKLESVNRLFHEFENDIETGSVTVLWSCAMGDTSNLAVYTL